MNSSDTLNELLSAPNCGIEEFEADFIRAHVPNAFLDSPITQQSREWLWTNVVVLEQWLVDRGNGSELTNERLKCQAFSDAETFSGNHLHAELMAKLDARVQPATAALISAA